MQRKCADRQEITWFAYAIASRAMLDHDCTGIRDHADKLHPTAPRETIPVTVR